MASDDYRHSVVNKIGKRTGQVLRILRGDTSVGLIGQQAFRVSDKDGSEFGSPPFATRELRGPFLQVICDPQTSRAIDDISPCKLASEHLELLPDGERCREKVMIRQIKQSGGSQLAQAGRRIQSSFKVKCAAIGSEPTCCDFEQRRFTDAIPSEKDSQLAWNGAKGRG